MILETLTPPTAEPVDIDLLRQHLRLNTDDEDDLVAFYLSAARERFEAETGRQLMTATYALWLDEIPTSNDAYNRPCYNRFIYLPRPPLVTVDEVAIVNMAEDVVVLVEDTDYTVDIRSMPGRVNLQIVPTLSHRTKPALRIEFTCGVEDGDTIRADWRQAIMLLAAHYYGQRETTVDRPLTELPYGFQRVVAASRTGVISDWNDTLFSPPTGWAGMWTVWGGSYR